MEATLGWIAAAIGAAGAMAGIFAPGDRERQGAVARLWVVAGGALLVTFALFLITRPVRPPFSFGQDLGYGALAGGVLGTIAGIWSGRGEARSAWASAIQMVLAPSLALIGVAFVLLVFDDYPQAALSGFMMAAVAAAVLFRFAIPTGVQSDLWGLSAAILAGTVLIAIFRFDTPAERFWWRAPLMILASGLVGHVIGSSMLRERRKFALPTVIGCVITLGLTAIFAWKIFPDWQLMWVASAGAATFAIAALLLAGLPIQDGNDAGSDEGRTAIIVLLLIALSALSFRLLGGFGIGIALLAGWPILLPLTARRVEEGVHPMGRALILAMYIGAGVLFYRLFLEQYDAELRGMDMRAHYTFVGTMLGAVFPFVALSFFPVPRNMGAVRRTISAGLLGLSSAAAPLVVLTLWGFRATIGMMMGMVSAQVFILFAASCKSWPSTRNWILSAALVLAAEVSLAQLAFLVGPYADSPRRLKAIILAAAVLVGFVLAGISTALGRGSAGTGEPDSRERLQA